MRRGSLLVLAALVAGVLITGAQARVLLQPDRASSAKKTTVTLTGWASSPAETAALRTTIRGFEKSHPAYKVNYAPINGDYPAAMMAKAGVKPPKTWAQLRSVAQKLKEANAVPGGAALCIDPDWARMLAFVYQNKGSFLNAKKTAPTVKSAAVRQAIQYYAGFQSAGLSGTHDKLGVGWCGEALGKEKAAIIFEGNWVVGFMAEQFPNVKYTISPLPKGKVNGNLGFTVSYSIGKNTKNKKAAFTLLSYLVGKQGMGLWTQQGIALPARSDVKVPAGRGALMKQAGYAHPRQL